MDQTEFVCFKKSRGGKNRCLHMPPESLCNFSACLSYGLCRPSSNFFDQENLCAFRMDKYETFHCPSQNCRRTCRKKINKEENNGDMSDIGEEFDFFYKLFHKNSKAGFIPNISSSMNQWMEFDQTFYSSKFDPKYDNEEQKFDFSLSGISVQDSDKVAELYDELDEEMDYYRLRLAAIAYDLSTLQTNYQFIFKQFVAGRFVTILGKLIFIQSCCCPN
ncbi:unnamed protein product [Moneuplotes crassus]|uniref:Uncharacterized protein n=1 Tax=Euplotes crassus TaxID=5936 RepID=A0AAD2DAK3_EUPCR|nr:unnamed protein product [Moneuplotes crassus]